MGVAEFAASLGVTPTHLTRCCKQACNRPASALLHDRLIFGVADCCAPRDVARVIDGAVTMFLARYGTV